MSTTNQKGEFELTTKENMTMNEREVLLSVSEKMLADEALRNSPAWKQTPELMPLFFEYCKHSNQSKACDIFKEWQRTLKGEIPKDKLPGDVGVKSIREKSRLQQRINAYWLYMYIVCTYTEINPMLHVLTNDFVMETIKRRGKKPKQPQQQSRQPRQDRSSRPAQPRDSRRDNRYDKRDNRDSFVNGNNNSYNQKPSAPKPVVRRWDSRACKYVAN
jgi:hypothetical protein